ncbi:hypothetical protein BGZ59_006058 [Podila verticillata]|nr:hypothetical protein BGZ59_006058 [Podila verticillata]
MSKNKAYSNIQDEEDDTYDPTSTSSHRRENTETIYGEPFVDNSLSKAPGTISPQGDSIRMASPISPTGSDRARAATMPGSLSKLRKAAQTAIHARRMSSKHRIVDVTTVDMSQTRCKPTKGMNNQEFLQWLKQPRPEWSKVRWININGMSWDVIKEISLKYDLHHLAVEDLLHVPQRTKVDIYPKQTYIACTLLTLMETMEDGELRQIDPTVAPHGLDPELLSKRIPLEKLDHYKYRYPKMQAYGALRVQMEQVTLFLLEDSTLITLFQVSGESVVNPIVERLAHDYNIARKQNDASFLLQSVIDGIVDHAIPITDAFRQEINELETHVLAMPRMKFTRDLHRMTAQLSMMKRTLAPTQSLVHALRGKDERSPLTNISKTYMGDVMDHCNTMVEDIDSMLALCEKLINMIFNLIAYDTNESMRKLAIVSIIFLPITFVAGVYGTNFENFPELKHNIGYFWSICGVVTAVVVLFIAGEWLFNEWRAASVERRLKRREPPNMQRVEHEHRHRPTAVAVPLALLKPWDKSAKNSGNSSDTGIPPDLVSPTQPLTPSSDNSAKANSYTPALDQPFDYANGTNIMRGVNLGGWLVLEPFITPSLFDPYISAGVVDEYTLCKHLGPDVSRKLLEDHYASWVTEDTFMRLRDLGLNHVRVPVGFWALGNLTADEPYVPNVAWNYLLRAIEWARKYGIRVMVELHAAPGSQNGWNHSGRSGLINWLNGTMGTVNAQRTATYVQQLATFFASPAYAHVGPIMGMLNEPAAYEIGAQKVKSWYTQTFNSVRQTTGAGKGPWIVIHDGFLGLEAFSGFMPKSDRLMLDEHQYIMFNTDLMKMTSTAQLQFACSTWGAASRSSTLQFGPTMVGEFSVAVNDCAKYLNGINSGSRWEGTFGEVSGSPMGSCVNENDASKYSSTYKQFLKNFFEAQVEAFEQGSGWFFWNFKTESNPLWSYFDGVDQGWIPKDVNNRGPGFCVANGFSLNKTLTDN